MAKLAQRHLLDLANALSSEMKDNTYLLEGPGLALVQSETQPQHRLLTGA